jgi:TrkA domain protein
MKINMTDLPGVGKRISLITAEDRMMVIIIHHSGKRELYFFDNPDDDEALFSFTLSSEETRQLGAQLLGTTFNPVETDKLERIKLVRNQVVVDWIDIQAGSSVLGKTYEELENIRPRNLKIVGVFQDEEFIVDPEPQFTIQAGHTFMVVGKREPIQEFEQLCEGEAKA